MEKSSRTRLFTGVVLAVVFSAGIVLGVAVGHEGTGVPATVARADSASTTQSDDSAGRRRRQPLYMQVDPTPEQKVRLDSILKQNHDSMRVLLGEFHQDYDPHYDSLQAAMDSLREAFRKKYDPRYQELISKTRAAIRQVLTADQATKWDSLMSKARHDDSVRAEADHARRRDDRGGDRGGGRDGGRDGGREDRN